MLRWLMRLKRYLEVCLMKNTKPSIRFAGFEDDWEERKLGEAFNYEQPTKYIVKATEYDDNFDIPVLTAGKSFLLGYTDEMSGIKNATVEDPVVIFDDFTTGSHYVDFPFKIKSSAMKLLSLNDDSDNFYFMFNTLKNIKYVPQSHERHWISKFSKFEIYKPSQEEQEEIGSFFKQLDNTITLHQRKIDFLKEMKKGYLQKMFPKDGDTVPEVRFAGFEDEWEARNLKDVVEKQIKGKAQFDKLGPGNVEYLDTSRLNGGPVVLTNGLQDVTRDDILILWDGSKAGTVYHGFEGALGSTLKAYRTSASSKFVYQYLKRHQDNIYNNYRTPNIPHVQKDFLDVFTINVPESDEQKKIGSFFKQLDNTIALHQRQLDLLKEMKKGYLQKMFV